MRLPARPLLLFFLLSTFSLADKQFYLSVSGSDGAGGESPASAWRTPGRAAEAVFFIKNGGPLLENITINLLPGTFYLRQPLVIASGSGGTGSARVTWAGPPGGGATLSGGAPLAPLSPAGEDLVMAVLPQSIWAESFVGQLFSLPPGGRGGGVRRPLSTTPVSTYKSVSYGARNATVTLAPGSADLALSGEEMRAARVLLYHTWTSSVSPVLTWAPPIFTTSWTSESDYGADARYALQNVLNASRLAPGTFMFDPASRVLTYRLAPGESTANLSLVAPALREVLASAPGAESVTFANLTLAHGGAFSEEDCGVDGCSYQSCADSNLAAVHLHGAVGWELVGLEVAHTGQTGVWIEDGCSDVALRRSWLHDLGGGGVRVGVTVAGVLPAGANLTRGVVVEDCAIEDGGHVCEAGTGILWHTAARGALRHNEICNFAYTGISVGWTWLYGPTDVNGVSVAFNHVHDVGMFRLSDLGGVYLVGAQDTVVENNLVHDVFAGANGAHAFYLDQACSGATVRRNVAYHTGTAVLQQHYGLGNLFDNNVAAFPTATPASPWPCSFAADCARAGLRSGTHAAGSGEGAFSSFTATRNILLLGAGADADSTLFATDVADGLHNMTFATNIYWATDGRALTFPPTQAPTSFAAWQAEGKDAGSRIVDPGFVDAAGGNFSLRPDSPARAMGIESVDVSTVGPRGGDPRERHRGGGADVARGARGGG